MTLRCGACLLPGLLTVLLTGLLGLGGLCPRACEAICPSKPAPGRAQPVPPPEVSPPFDPPAPLPVVTPPDEPRDAPLPATAPQEPPSALPPAPTPPEGTPPAAGPLSPRRAPGVRPLDALDDAAWEAWWGLNRSDVLPQVRRQAEAPRPAGYARTLPAALRPAVDALLEGLGDDDLTVVQAAAAALAVLHTDYRAGDILEALQLARHGRDLWVRDLACLALARRGDATVAPDLVHVLRNRSEHSVSRAFAALGLIALGDGDGLRAVAAAAGDLSEPDLAGSVLIALGQTRDLRHLPVLLEAAQRRVGASARLRRVRCDALIGLGKLAAPAVVPYIATLLCDREKAIARSAAIALGGFRGDAGAVRALAAEGLGAEDPFVRAYAALSLGRLGDPTVLPRLAALRADREPAVRPFALLALGLLHSGAGAPLLREALVEDPRTGANAAAALAAGLLPAPTWTPLLLPAVADTRTLSVPAANALGLGLLGAESATLPLRRGFWLDGVRSRPGFAQALALLDPAGQARWLSRHLGQARRSGARQVLVDALALCAGPEEAGALVTLWKAAPHGDSALRARVLSALASVVNDREVSFAHALLAHTCCLQPNQVLAHLAVLP